MDLKELIEKGRFGNLLNCDIKDEIVRIENLGNKTDEEFFILASLKLLEFTHWSTTDTNCEKYFIESQNSFNELRNNKTLFKAYYSLFVPDLDEAAILVFSDDEIIEGILKQVFFFIFFLQKENSLKLIDQISKLILNGDNRKWLRFIRGTLNFFDRNLYAAIGDYFHIDDLANKYNSQRLDFKSRFQDFVFEKQYLIPGYREFSKGIDADYFTKYEKYLESDRNKIKISCYSYKSKLNFGVHQGKYIYQVLEKDSEYILWCMINLEHFCLTSLEIEFLKKENKLFEKAVLINSAKWKLLAKKSEIEDEIQEEWERDQARRDDADDAYFNEYLEGDWDNEWNID